MTILNYGLFWQRNQVEWNPGIGRKGGFRLIGRRREKYRLRLANFRQQSGIYILYSNHGVYYVGVATEDSLGIRLKNHHDNNLDSDGNPKNWFRFSWFGFRRVNKSYKDKNGFDRLAKKTKIIIGDTQQGIKDIESLLIRAMGPSSQNEMRFTREQKWKQVGNERIEYYQKLLGI